MSPDETWSIVASLVVFFSYTFYIVYHFDHHTCGLRSSVVLLSPYVAFIACTIAVIVARFRINNTTAAFFLLAAWKTETSVLMGFLLVKRFVYFHNCFIPYSDWCSAQVLHISWPLRALRLTREGLEFLEKKKRRCPGVLKHAPWGDKAEAWHSTATAIISTTADVCRPGGIRLVIA